MRIAVWGGFLAAAAAAMAGDGGGAPPGGPAGLVWNLAAVPALVYRDEGAMLAAAAVNAGVVAREGTVRWEARDAAGMGVGRGGPETARLEPGAQRMFSIRLLQYPSGGELRLYAETAGASPDRRVVKFREAAAPDIADVTRTDGAFADGQGHRVVFVADRADAAAARKWGIPKWMSEQAASFPRRLWVMGDSFDAGPGNPPAWFRELARLAPAGAEVEFLPREPGGGFFGDALALDRKLAGGTAPDMVFLLPGLQDARARVPVEAFRRGLDFLLGRLRVRGAGKMRVMLAGPVPYPVAGEIDRLQAGAVREAARDHGVSFTDLATLAERPEWSNAFRDGEDPVYRPWPDVAGQGLLAEVLRAALP